MADRTRPGGAVLPGAVAIVLLLAPLGACSSAPTTPTADGDPDLVATDPPRTTAPEGGPSGIEVVITSAGPGAESGQVDVAAIVTGVLAEEAECVLTVTQGEITVESRTAAVPDVSSTSCGLMSVTDPGFVGGTATATVTFTGPTGASSSATTPVEIP